jgi:hypothetical protein
MGTTAPSRRNVNEPWLGWFSTHCRRHVVRPSDGNGIGKVRLDFAARWKNSGKMDDGVLTMDGQLDIFRTAHIAPLDVNTASSHARSRGHIPGGLPIQTPHGMSGARKPNQE